MPLILKVLLFLVTTTVMPVVVNKTTDGERLKWIQPYLREIWLALLVFYVLAAMFVPSVREAAVAANQRIKDSAHPDACYFVVVSLGCVLLLCYWWFTGIIAPKPITQAKGVTWMAEEKDKSHTYNIHQNTQGGPGAITTGANSPITINQGWKQLTTTEFSNGASFLGQFKGQRFRFWVANQDNDRIQLAQGLAEMLKAAGWKFEGIHTPMFWGDPMAEPQRGIQLHVKTVTESANALGNVLAEFLGIENMLHGHQDASFEDGIIEVKIWPVKRH
jgi:hypothetical protein